jgi:elongation factor G
MKASSGAATTSAPDSTVEIPADLADEADEYREKLIEAVAEADDEIMEKYLEGEEITVDDELLKAMRKATLAYRDRPRPVRLGVQEQGRAAAARRRRRLPPSPARRAAGRPGTPRGRGDRARAEPTDEPFAALAFKIMATPRRQAHLLPRLLRHAQAGSYVSTASKGKKERIGRILQMHANNREEIDDVSAGDIVAASASRTPTPATRSATRATRSCSSR